MPGGSAQRARCALPPEYYASAEILHEERRLILHRQWTYVGHARQLRSPGDFLVADASGASVVLVRGDGGELRGFRNECRHRGYPFCDALEGSVRAFVCPFHRWTYDLDGRLVDAGGVPDGAAFDYRERGLHAVAVEVWRGLIFVCPAPDAPPAIGDAIEALVPELAQVDPGRLKPAAVRSYEVAANWKLLLEHHPYCASRAGSHVELERVLELTAVRDGSTDATGARFVAEAPRLRAGMRSASRDGRAVSRPLGRFADGADPLGWSAGLRAQPAPLEIVAYPDHLVVHAVSAARVDRSLWTIHWLVHEDAEEGRDYVLDELTYVWDETLRQHVALVEEARRDGAAAEVASDPRGLAEEPRVRSALKAYVLALEGGAP